MWIPPDHLHEGPGPLAAMAAAASVTTELIVGPLVFDCDFRHPARLARELATIDQLAEGRLEVGLGAGWRRLDYAQAGIAMDRPPGGPPILIGGGAPRVLRFAGATADIVGVYASIHSGEIDTEAARDGQADRIDQKVGWVREGAGDRFDDLEMNAWLALAHMTDDAQGLPRRSLPVSAEHRTKCWSHLSR